jgi:AcrR family transcriptional regulator
MRTSPPGSSPAPTRRARQRAATTEEIKALARRQLAEQGPGALSLRAIARQMGTASSALYRYFPSQSDLITALCVEAYESLADAVVAARDAHPPGEHARRWAALCHAWRRWSLEHPADFALNFGTPLPGYHAPREATAAAAGRSFGAAAAVYAAAVRAGAADPARAQIPAGLRTGALWPALTGDNAHPGDPALAGIVLSAWASLLGYLAAEIFGSLTQLITSTDLLYQAHVRTMMLGMGYQPALIDPAVTG